MFEINLLSSPAGELEILTTSPSEISKTNAVAIICHPHPLQGGTMSNKVVTTLARTFDELGLATVRFNFRGVGKSTGHFGEGIGEIEDLLTVMAWVKKVCPEKKIWLAGFSFGAFIAIRVATDYPVAQLVSVAPWTARFDSLALPVITCPWVLVQGGQDEIVSPAEVFAWVEKLNPKPVLLKLPKATHFFHGQLIELRTQLKSILKSPPLKKGD